jgi:octaprenyl-diphosphate synthase
MESVLEFKEIYRHISIDLARVELELKTQLESGSTIKNSTDEIVGYFFNKKGKFLRPVLVLLSSGITDNCHSEKNESIIKLAASVELIHSASLLHDDVIDGSIYRRKQPVMNKKFGNKIAILTGDILFSRAFSILTENFDTRILKIMSSCIEKMCRAEIIELRKPLTSFDKYLRIIEDKTARFMSVCCQSAAIIKNGDTEVVLALRNFGQNFGIAYQIVDDYLDGDVNFLFDIDLLEKAEEFGALAKENLLFFPDSNYKSCLNNLIDHLMAKCEVPEQESLKRMAVQ